LAACFNIGLNIASDINLSYQVEQRSGFWLIADAVKQFYDKHGCLPLPGKLPDMKAKSNVYVQLQNIYKAKARKDAAEILEAVRAMPGGDRVDPAEVELFCKNAAFVKLVNATGGPNAKTSKADRLKAVAGELYSFSMLSSYHLNFRTRGFWPRRQRMSSDGSVLLCVLYGRILADVDSRF
jgi:hypothetical protein